jgi:D-glycero-D-manno-heptose 1,7-bisphosphate phosphatase
MGFDVSTINREWSLFLDRDGVINARIMDGYVLKASDFVFLPGVVSALADLATRFRHIIIVTNQQGIGKGLMTEADLAMIHKMMIADIEAGGGRVDAVLHCPEPASAEDNCRKPGAVMGLQAKKMFPGIRFGQSVMLGDTPSDMEFARGLGMKAIFVGADDSLKNPDHPQCDLRVQSLQEFARLFFKKNH